MKISCPGCNGPRIVLDEKFWETRNVRMKRALWKDPLLLPTVKAEWESMREGSPLLPSPPYPFPKPMAWLSPRWEEARKPPGRPIRIGAYYRLHNIVQFLRDSGLSLKYIVDVIAKERGKTSAKECASIEAEIRSARRLVENQRADPQARLQGTRIKETKLSKGKAQLTRKGSTAQPTERDRFRFSMVSAYVRQVGLTKQEAIKRLSQIEGFSSTKDIEQSLNRFDVPNPELYWRPGIIRDMKNMMMKH